MLTGDTAVAQVRLRYKLPGESVSRPLSVDVPRSVLRQARAPQGDMAFAVAVAGYGQLLRGDTHMGQFSFADAAQLARRHGGRDAARQEFVTLAERAEALSNPTR
jgi:Ca-activated chloride channel family protein